MDEVALEQISLQILWISFVSVIPPKKSYIFNKGEKLCFLIYYSFNIVIISLFLQTVFNLLLTGSVNHVDISELIWESASHCVD